MVAFALVLTRGRRSNGTVDLRGRDRVAEQPTPEAYEHAKTRPGGKRCGCCDDGRGHSDGWCLDDRCRRGRQESRYGCGLLIRLLVAAAGRIDDLGGRRHLVAGPLELRLLNLVVADASDRVLRGLDVAVRNDQQLDVALVLERAQPLALLVDEVGGDFHRHLGDDLGGTVLADLLADQAQQGERHRLDGADAADAGAARAHLVTGITQ